MSDIKPFSIAGNTAKEILGTSSRLEGPLQPLDTTVRALSENDLGVGPAGAFPETVTSPSPFENTSLARLAAQASAPSST